MSQISLKSISGITSITTPAGVDNRFSLYNYDSTERLVLDHSGNLNISGVSTATNFKTGSSNLHSTGLTVGDSFVHSTGINLGTGVTFLNNGNATLDNVSISGIATVGILTATTLRGLNTKVFNVLEVDGPAWLDGGAEFGTRTYNKGYASIDTLGIATFSGVSVSGVLTATSFVGSGALLTGIVGGKFNGPAAGILTTSTVGIQTADVTSADLVGAATSMVGLYIGDGHLLFSNYLNRSGGYYITTGLNALNAGPVTLGTSMKLDGTWVIV